MPLSVLAALCWTVWTSLAGVARADGEDAAGLELFEARVGPLLAARCLDCHGGVERRAGLSLATRADVLAGGGRGPAVVPGDPGNSPLLAVLRREPGALAMPPDRPLAAAELADLERWIELGAPYGDEPLRGTWWSFAPRSDPAPPAVEDGGWCAGELDRFVLAPLEAAGIAPAPPAPRAQWLRRVSFDLTGLPPTPAELEAFLGDGDPGAEERVVARLLASRAYGERFGRLWLDLARYADTAGDSSDYPIEDAWRYRDWVVGSFERDLPYDEFLRLQLAGDLLADESVPEEYSAGVIATGFLALARRFGVGKDAEMHLVREDSLDTLGRAVLGLSLSCARCHDHPFDPIPQRDYFALEGILASTIYPFPGSEEERAPDRLVPLLAPRELEARLAEHARLVEEFQTREAQLEAERRERAELERRARLTAAAATRVEPPPDPQSEARTAPTPPAPPRFETAYACREGQARDVPLLEGGNPRRRGESVPRGFPAALVLEGAPRIDGRSGSGRRELADWLTRADHPLTARVWANRVWAQLMGQGIVATPSDFGRQGARPSDPALLDWLAARLVEDGWSTRALVRRIVLSAAYRRATPMGESEHGGARPAFAWHPRRRLSAEELRDALLAVAGALEHGSPGAHPFPERARWKWTQHDPFPELYDHDWRSLYLMVPRLRRHPFLALFDGADANASHALRGRTIAPSQAHFLANDPWMHALSERAARRVAAERGSEGARVESLWRLAYARSPEARELEDALEFLDSYAGDEDEAARLVALAALARVVFSSNGFLYLD